MKKIIALMMIVTIVLGMTACGGTGMTISKAELNDDEQAIVKLLKNNKETSILDYKVDDTVKSMTINVQELDKNGKWKNVSEGGGFGMSENEDRADGRIAIAFRALPDSLYTAFNGSTLNGTDKEPSKNMAYVTVLLEEPMEIEYGKPVPVALQMMSKNDSIASSDLGDYYDTKKLTKKKYDHVYAVTVTFSQKEL